MVREAFRYRKPPPTVRNEATRCGHCVASSDPRMRPLRSGPRFEDAAIVGVVPTAATTLLLRVPRIAPSLRSLPSTRRPREHPHSAPRNALPRGRPSPAQNTPSPAKKNHHPETPPTQKRTITTPKHPITTGSKAETRITIVPPTT